MFESEKRTIRNRLSAQQKRILETLENAGGHYHFCAIELTAKFYGYKNPKFKEVDSNHLRSIERSLKNLHSQNLVICERLARRNLYFSSPKHPINIQKKWLEEEYKKKV